MDNILTGYYNKVQFQTQNQWDQARLIAYHSSTFVDKVPTMLEFLTFPWDEALQKKAARNLLTQEQMREKFKT